MFPEEKNKIEELKKTLYSRENFKPDNPVHDLPRKTYEVNNTWTAPVEPIKRNKKRLPLGTILVWFSIIFFLVAVGIAAYVYYNGYNTISADNVDITVTGPTMIDAGANATFAIAMDNKNQIDLQDAYLNISYPDGARRDSTQTEPLVADRISLGTVTSGTHLDRTISAAFFGLQNSQETIRISLEYHVLGSANLFAKEKDYLFTLAAGPISVTVTHAAQINSGQDVSFAITVTSNSTATISGLALNAAYPFGFTFKSATPTASLNNSIWQLGDLAPGSSKTVTIIGKVEGQENEQRAFKFNVGISNPADRSQIATIFSVDTETIAIQKPFIGLAMTFDGNSTSAYPTYAGSTINASLAYSNNTPTTLTDALVSIKLDGVILDKSSVTPAQGFYQSANNTITWDSRSVPALATLNPGDNGNVQFSFKTLPFSAGALYTKSSQKISLSSSVNANQVASGGTTPISSAITNTAVVNSNINLSASAFYNGGLFKNTGPIPPMSEKTTTYTVNWSISNTFNNTSNVAVSAVLPPYVKFLNNISPQNENVTYNALSGEVDWNVGNIKTNTGYASAPRQVSFQVSILPSLTQVGMTPTLMGDSTLKATDTFTTMPLTTTADSLTTDIKTDPQYKYGQGVVGR